MHVISPALVRLAARDTPAWHGHTPSPRQANTDQPMHADAYPHPSPVRASSRRLLSRPGALLILTARLARTVSAGMAWGFLCPCCMPALGNAIQQGVDVQSLLANTWASTTSLFAAAIEAGMTMRCGHGLSFCCSGHGSDAAGRRSGPRTQYIA